MQGGRWLTGGETGGGEVQKGEEGEEKGRGRKGSEGIRELCI